MNRYNTTLLTPPKEEEEVHPYRRAWTSIAYTVTGLAFMSLVSYVLFGVVGISISESLRFYISIGVAILPAVLWMIFAWSVERKVPQPRAPLLSVVLVSALFANAVMIPFIEQFLDVDRWLSLQSAIDRIIGYTFTVGIVQTATMYIILRYMIWKHYLRIRLDAVAYSEAVAIGLTVVSNIVFVFSGNPPLDVVAARVYSTYAIYIVASIILAYGLAISKFDADNLFILPTSVMIASLSTGIAIPIRSGLINTSFSFIAGQSTTIISAPRPIFGLGFTIGFSILPLLIVSFLLANADRKDQEVEQGER